MEFLLQMKLNLNADTGSNTVGELTKEAVASLEAAKGSPETKVVKIQNKTENLINFILFIEIGVRILPYGRLEINRSWDVRILQKL